MRPPPVRFFFLGCNYTHLCIALAFWNPALFRMMVAATAAAFPTLLSRVSGLGICSLFVFMF
jgi:hypothetical protein